METRAADVVEAPAARGGDRANARGGEAIDGGSRGETETSERREKRVVESTRGGDAR